MKIGIMINTNEPESAWNALRFANVALSAKHEVEVFLIGRGVELDSVAGGKFDAKGQLDAFIGAGGKLLACGTCMKLRGKESSKTCPLSTLKDLLALVERCDKLLSFG
ncbi:MAG: DsrE family protein [Candidatus Micrarchaeota archaeon]|nr:DsrE family protein [Candidatus Micrarchaeota archaeon]